MNQWFEYKIRKKLHRRLARAAAVAIRSVRSGRQALGFGAGRTFETSTYGVRMRANWDDRTFQYCHFGVYGRVLSDYLAGYDQQFVFLDIGANQGLYSLLAARNPRCLAVVALEPVAGTFELLRQNVEENGFASRTTLVRAALAERAGTAAISVAAGHSGIATLARDSNQDYDPQRAQTVELIDAAGLDRHIPAGAGIVAKVDVEGYEQVVLAELLRSANAARIATIFYEVDTRWNNGEVLRDLLASGGFANFTRHGRTRHYDVMATRARGPQP